MNCVLKIGVADSDLIKGFFPNTNFNNPIANATVLFLCFLDKDGFAIFIETMSFDASPTCETDFLQFGM